MKQKMLLSLVCLFVSANLAMAQVQAIVGAVVDEDGQPVIGASVLIKGTSVGVITNVDGRFTLSNVPSSAKTLQSP